MVIRGLEMIIILTDDSQSQEDGGCDPTKKEPASVLTLIHDPKPLHPGQSVNFEVAVIHVESGQDIISYNYNPYIKRIESPI